MIPFEFKGDWEFEHTFEAFKGLQSRRGSYTSQDSIQVSNGSVHVIIIDELNDEIEPTETQINAINYLTENPKKIQEALFKALESEYPKLKEIYGYDEEDEDSREWFPNLSSLDDFRKVFGVGNISIYRLQKEDYSYVGIECGCTWDDEHGLGFLLHKDRILQVGSADVSFSFSSIEALNDNGTLSDKTTDRSNVNKEKKQLSKPKFYKPHPKFGKLKPSQVYANKMYENYLIERGYNQEFIDLVESNKIDINVNKGLSMTFLERAAQFNNLEIIKYILSKNPISKKKVLHRSIGRCNKELVEILLENGVDINEQDYRGRTILKLVEQEISQIRNNSSSNQYHEFKNWLESKGAK